MNIEHLEYFCLVAKTGSLNKAAAKLFISQPQLGKIISSLENELDTVLIIRNRSGITLTPEGKKFCEYAQSILQEYKKMRTIKTLMPEHPDSSIEVSIVRFTHFLENFMRAIKNHSESPGFSHKLLEGNPEEVIDDVTSHRTRLGIIYFDAQRYKSLQTVFKSRHLEYNTLAIVKPCVLLRENHPLMEKGDTINLEDLSSYPFVRYYGEYEDFTNCIHCGDKEYDLNQNSSTIYVSGRSSLLNIIQHSDGFGIGIRNFTDQKDHYKVESMPIKDCNSELEFGYIIPDNEKLNEATEEFLALTRRYFSHLYSS